MWMSEDENVPGRADDATMNTSTSSYTYPTRGGESDGETEIDEGCASTGIACGGEVWDAFTWPQSPFAVVTPTSSFDYSSPSGAVVDGVGGLPRSSLRETVEVVMVPQEVSEIVEAVLPSHANDAAADPTPPAPSDYFRRGTEGGAWIEPAASSSRKEPASDIEAPPPLRPTPTLRTSRLGGGAVAAARGGGGTSVSFSVPEAPPYDAPPTYSSGGGGTAAPRDASGTSVSFSVPEAPPYDAPPTYSSSGGGTAAPRETSGTSVSFSVPEVPPCDAPPCDAPPTHSSGGGGTAAPREASGTSASASVTKEASMPSHDGAAGQHSSVGGMPMLEIVDDDDVPKKTWTDGDAGNDGDETKKKKVSGAFRGGGDGAQGPEVFEEDGGPKHGVFRVTRVVRSMLRGGNIGSSPGSNIGSSPGSRSPGSNIGSSPERRSPGSNIGSSPGRRAAFSAADNINQVSSFDFTVAEATLVEDPEEPDLILADRMVFAEESARMRPIPPGRAAQFGTPSGGSQQTITPVRKRNDPVYVGVCSCFVLIATTVIGGYLGYLIGMAL